MDAKESIDDKYPLALINWGGAKKGGVRKPFRKDSGRPVRKQLKTALVKRLEQWAGDIIAGKSGTPRAILLVGGPGNGKTDAVEGCIQFIDEKLGLNGSLYMQFESQYQIADGSLPPRRAEATLPSQIKLADGLAPTIWLVQDATEKDSKEKLKSAESLFLEELRLVQSGEFRGIYICCVNRGILANSALLASREHDDELRQLLNLMVEAASGGPSAPPCWPLNSGEIALWPMDVESLVSSVTNESNKTIANEILSSALDDDFWQEFCVNKTICPFCQNKIILSSAVVQNNLIRFLHYYEMGSGKRWTFRDLYSLISYLLIGDPSTLTIKGKSYSPCEWTAKQLDIAKKNEMTSARAKVPYLLAGRLYHHRLFSNWPRLSSGRHYNAQNQIFRSNKVKNDEIEEGLQFAKRHFLALKSLTSAEHNSISEILTREFSQLLDPALLHGEMVLFQNDGLEPHDVTVNMLDERFSLSVSDGLELVKTRLHSSERALLEELAKADEALLEHHYDYEYASSARLLQASVRQFSARFAKRSLGVRYGVMRDKVLFADYKTLQEDGSLDSKIKKQVGMLVNEQGKDFKIPLSTTFGQPVSHRDRNVSLVVRKITFKLKKISGDDSRPEERLPYLQIHKRDIPLTFSLFKALNEVGLGLNPASLSPEVFAMIDEVKSVTAGQIARDVKFVDENVDLEIGNKKYELEIGESIQFIGGNDD